MKILLITSRIPFPLKDGGAIATYSHAKGFVEQGHEVTMLSLNTKKHFVDNETIQKEFHDLVNVKTVEIDTKVKAWPAFKSLIRGGSYNIERFYSKEFADLIENEISVNEYDLIQFESLFVAEYIKHTKSSNAIKVLRQHNAEHVIWERLAKSEVKGSLKAKYISILALRLKQYESSVLNDFDAIVAISASDRDVFRKLGCHVSIYVTPVGVKINRFHTWNKTVYHIGSIEWEANSQGLRWFVKQVWPLVINDVPDALFCIAGKSLQKDDTRFNAKNVRVDGEVDDVVEYSSDKSILVVPLLSGSGIRVKALEGMALGKAVVSTKIGAQGINNDNESLLVSGKADEFAGHIIKLLEDEDYYKTITNKGIELIESNYTREKVISDLLVYYEARLSDSDSSSSLA